MTKLNKKICLYICVVLIPLILITCSRIEISNAGNNAIFQKINISSKEITKYINTNNASIDDVFTYLNTLNNMDVTKDSLDLVKRSFGGYYNSDIKTIMKMVEKYINENEDNFLSGFLNKATNIYNKITVYVENMKIN